MANLFGYSTSDIYLSLIFFQNIAFRRVKNCKLRIVMAPKNRSLRMDEIH